MSKTKLKGWAMAICTDCIGRCVRLTELMAKAHELVHSGHVVAGFRWIDKIAKWRLSCCTVREPHRKGKKGLVW